MCEKACEVGFLAYLKNERETVHEIELEKTELDGALQHRIRLHVRVDFEQRGNDEQKTENEKQIETLFSFSDLAFCFWFALVPVSGEYLLKVSTGVDVGGQACAHHAHVLAVEYERAVDNAEKERNVPHGRGLRVHRGEHGPDELAPRVLVQHVGGEELAVAELVEEVEVGLERLAHQHGQLGQLLVHDGGVRVRVARVAAARRGQHAMVEEHLALLERLRVERRLLEKLDGLFGVHLRERQLWVEVSTKEVKVAHICVRYVQLIFRERESLLIA